MLRLQNLQHYTIGANDGEVGQVETVYFDDESWTVRYLVVDTGNWLSGRKVLISPRSHSGGQSRAQNGHDESHARAGRDESGH